MFKINGGLRKKDISRLPERIMLSKLYRILWCGRDNAQDTLRKLNEERIKIEKILERLTCSNKESIRAGKHTLCDICDMKYEMHLYNLDELDYEDNPFLIELCDGQLVKL